MRATQIEADDAQAKTDATAELIRLLDQAKSIAAHAGVSQEARDHLHQAYRQARSDHATNLAASWVDFSKTGV